MLVTIKHQNINQMTLNVQTLKDLTKLNLKIVLKSNVLKQKLL